MPRTRYATTRDGVDIAYQVLGEGRALVVIDVWISNIEVYWELPNYAEMLRQLSSFATVIHFDKRGVGMSDRISRVPDLDARMEDLLAVLQATGTERAALFGIGDGAALAALFAATFPDRTTALIFNGRAREMWAPDYPWGRKAGDEEDEMRRLREIFGDDAHADEFVEMCFGGIEGVPEDPAFGRWLMKLLRFAGTPNSVSAYAEMLDETDVRHVLAAVHVPTLVIHAEGDSDEFVAQEAYAAERIPGAKLARFSGGIWWGGPEDLVAKIAAFLHSVGGEEADLDRTLATVLFTDIVGSTERALALGDRAWRELVERHHATVRAMLQRYRGREMDTAGDGFFATFDGPARGIRCALAIAEAVRPLGLEVRAGLHTGEVETIEAKVGGIAVNIGARVCAEAGASEVLVSQTVKDLVAGSGLAFEDAGERELKGVPDRWRLYRVVSA
jgi:class 3 adenylate cyclase